MLAPIFTRRSKSRLAEAATAARQGRRIQKRQDSRLLRVVRSMAVGFALIFATVGIGAGAANAWPWSDMEDNITAFVTNFCQPENVASPVTVKGVDTIFGLNEDTTTNRQTVLPATDGLDEAPINGLERVQAAYSGQQDVIKPTYQRYGVSVLQWSNFGSGCFSLGHWFVMLSNAALLNLVVLPTTLTMFLLDLAMGNILYTIFSAIISPFVSIFSAVFTPWAYIVAPLGVGWMFIRSVNRPGGPLRPTVKAALVSVFCIGMLLWMDNQTSWIVTNANNFVTKIAGSAADEFNETQGTDVPGGTALDEVNQALWYGVPYQTWLEGTLGPEAAAADRNLDASGEVSWGAVIMNSRYVGYDDGDPDSTADADAIRAAIDEWNSLSYSESGDSEDSKPYAWTSDEKPWTEIPWLFTVKALCGDTAHGEGFLNGENADPENNRWFYGGSCDSASAGTSTIIPYFTGEEYNAQIVIALAGMVAAIAVGLAAGGAALYLAAQKMLFYFLLLFGPVFLTLAAAGDEKRAKFASRYFELMGANVIKQAVAVVVVLFISNAMSMLLYPPNTEEFAALRDIPYLVKPILALLFFIALALFMAPLRKIVLGAARGDTSVVDKTARAPVDAAKTGAKVAGGVAVGAAAIAAVAATGGAAAPVLAKAGGAAMSAGRVAGRGGVGKNLRRAGHVMNMAGRAGQGVQESQGKKQALASATQQLMQGASGDEMRSRLSNVPGALNKDGSLTAKGQKIAEGYVQRTSKQGQAQAQADALQSDAMKKFFAGHKAETGQHHELDPQSEKNQMAVAAEKERFRKAAKEAAKRPLDADGNPVPTAAGEAAKEAANSAANSSGRTGADQQTLEGARDPQKAAANAGTNADAANAGTNAAAAGLGAGAADAAAAAQAANGAPKDSALDAQFEQQQTREQYATAARDHVSGPVFNSAHDEMKANVTVSGTDIARQMGLKDPKDAASNPMALLTGAAYEGGDTSRMDPRHSATAALNELRFASSSGDEQGMTIAATKASEAIARDGLPNQISGISSIGDTAANFQPAQVIGAMPSISESTPWAERAEGANTMQAAMSLIPESSPAHGPVQAYTTALSDPAVDADTVETLRGQAISSFPDAVTAPSGPAPVDSSSFDEAVTAANIPSAEPEMAAPAVATAAAPPAAAPPAAEDDTRRPSVDSWRTDDGYTYPSESNAQASSYAPAAPSASEGYQYGRDSIESSAAFSGTWRDDPAPSGQGWANEDRGTAADAPSPALFGHESAGYQAPPTIPSAPSPTEAPSARDSDPGDAQYAAWTDDAPTGPRHAAAAAPTPREQYDDSQAATWGHFRDEDDPYTEPIRAPRHSAAAPMPLPASRDSRDAPPSPRPDNGDDQASFMGSLGNFLRGDDIPVEDPPEDIAGMSENGDHEARPYQERERRHYSGMFGDDVEDPDDTPDDSDDDENEEAR